MSSGGRIPGRLSGARSERLREQVGMPWVADQLDGLRGAADELERRINANHADVLERLHKLERIEATTAWVRALPADDTLVSVIVPTHNRAELLREAVASVLRSTHERFELLVVDDASSDETPTVLAELAAADPRVRPLRHEENRGGGPARTTALQAAQGSLVAYLDDDNLMAADWLRAVAWAFAERPQAEVLYGALLIQPADDLAPYVQFERWDHRRHELEGLIDQSALAHRAGLVEARQPRGFGSDWEMSARLVRERDPVELPVVAVSYRQPAHLERSTSTAGPALYAEWTRLQQLILRGRPLRVVGAPEAAPLLRDLAAEGATVHVWGGEADGLERAPSDLWDGVARIVPDIALLAGDGRDGQRAVLERLAVPAAALPGTGADAPLGEIPGGLSPSGLRTWLLQALDRHRARLMGYPEPDGEPLPLA